MESLRFVSLIVIIFSNVIAYRGEADGIKYDTNTQTHVASTKDWETYVRSLDARRYLKHQTSEDFTVDSETSGFFQFNGGEYINFLKTQGTRVEQTNKNTHRSLTDSAVITFTRELETVTAMLVYQDIVTEGDKVLWAQRGEGTSSARVPRFDHNYTQIGNVTWVGKGAITLNDGDRKTFSLQASESLETEESSILAITDSVFMIETTNLTHILTGFENTTFQVTPKKFQNKTESLPRLVSEVEMNFPAGSLEGHTAEIITGLLFNSNGTSSFYLAGIGSQWPEESTLTSTNWANLIARVIRPKILLWPEV